MVTLQDLKDQDEAPQWLTEEAFLMLHGGYLQENETPKNAYRRVAKTVSSDLNKPELEQIFFDMIWQNWLCPASPVLSNSGTNNLQISCFSGRPFDDTYDIMRHVQEMVMLTKYGGGVGSSFSDLRPKGSKISRGGVTDGIVPFLKMLEAAIDGTRQGATRRGAVASYLPLTHGDIEEFLDVRKPTGDLNRRCLTKSFHNAVTIDNESMNRIIHENGKERGLWNKLMTNRVETGEPYVMFTDNSNTNCPEVYKGRISQSNLCSEIMAPVTEEETFVCCLSSVNAAKYNEWKTWKCPKTNKNFIELCIYFLDGVLTGFIKNAKHLPGLENAVRFAENHRLLGLGVLGWHTLLQMESIPFESFQAMSLNAEFFSQMRSFADKASKDLAVEYGECKETKGTGRRNTATLAIAPTMSNSVLSGGISQGIEPITANLFVQKGSKGNFIKKNPILLNKLIEMGKDTFDVWDQINADKGSVKNLKFLSQNEKEVFATAREINQYAIVRQAAQRQKWVDQAQSINLFFSLPQSKNDIVKVSRYINEVHIEAWKLGIKSLYYLKTESPLKGEALYKDINECKACES
jgi:ribonucleoside-diphosphate reductase alpha chain